MPNIVISEEVDIYKLPEVISPLGTDDEITIGDLHASAMKFIFMLVKHGIAEGLCETNYKKLVAICTKLTEHLNTEDIKEFDRILDGVKFNNHALVRLIGDEFSDRSSNDYFVLRVFQKLKQANVKVQTLLSNHGFDFVCALEGGDIAKSQLMVNPCRSKLNLIKLIEKRILINEKVVQVAIESYLPSLQLISYSLSEDKKDIAIYTHASVDLKIIQKVAEKLAVFYQDNTAEALAKTMDEINRKFQENYVKQNKVTTLSSAIKVGAIAANKIDMQDYLSGDNNYAFDLLLWNRRLPSEWRAVSKRDDKSISNFYGKGYKLTFVHGHDGTARNLQDLESLDTNLGKDQTQEPRIDEKFRVPNNKGNYKVFIHQKTMLQLNSEIDETKSLGNRSVQPVPASHYPQVFHPKYNNAARPSPNAQDLQSPSIVSLIDSAVKRRNQAGSISSDDDRERQSSLNTEALSSQVGMFSMKNSVVTAADVEGEIIDNIEGIIIRREGVCLYSYKMTCIAKDKYERLLASASNFSNIQICSKHSVGEMGGTITFFLKNNFSIQGLRQYLLNLNLWSFKSAITPIDKTHYDKKYGLKNVNNEKTMYQGIINLFDDYTRGDSWFSRAIHLNLGRNHVALIASKVRDMRAALKEKKIITLSDIEEVLTEVASASARRNPEGSLSRRLTYLRKQYEKTFEAQLPVVNSCQR